MNDKVVNVDWLTDNWDSELLKLYKESSLDLLSVEISDNDIDNILHVNKDKVKYVNSMIQNTRDGKSNFSVGATIAVLANKVSPFVIPPDLIRYIQNEIPSTEIYNRYMSVFIKSEDELRTGADLVNVFLDAGYSSQAALALTGSTWTECHFNPNVFNKIEKSGSEENGTGNWSGCGEGLFGLTYWSQKKKIIEKLGLNQKLVPVYKYDSKNGINKMNVIEVSISNDILKYNKGPFPDNGIGKACLFQCKESVWIDIMKEYINELPKASEDTKTILEYLMYDGEPLGSDNPEDDDHKLLYASYLYKAGPGYSKSFESIVDCTDRYKRTHKKQGVKIPINGFVEQLLAAYVLGEYMTGKKAQDISLDEILTSMPNNLSIKATPNILNDLKEKIIERSREIFQKMGNFFKGKFNVGAARDWILEHSTPSTQHACAKYIRLALEAGGLSTIGRPNWAWHYINYLPTIGFYLVDIVSRNNMNNYTPEIGDIAVYQKNGNPDVPGHICMWTGQRWCSDFKQNSMIVYKNTNEAYIFRWGGGSDENTTTTT